MVTPADAAALAGDVPARADRLRLLLADGGGAQHAQHVCTELRQLRGLSAQWRSYLESQLSQLAAGAGPAETGHLATAAVSDGGAGADFFAPDGGGRDGGGLDSGGLDGAASDLFSDDGAGPAEPAATAPPVTAPPAPLLGPNGERIKRKYTRQAPPPTLKVHLKLDMAGGEQWAKGVLPARLGPHSRFLPAVAAAHARAAAITRDAAAAHAAAEAALKAEAARELSQRNFDSEDAGATTTGLWEWLERQSHRKLSTNQLLSDLFDAADPSSSALEHDPRLALSFLDEVLDKDEDESEGSSESESDDEYYLDARLGDESLSRRLVAALMVPPNLLPTKLLPSEEAAPARDGSPRARIPRPAPTNGASTARHCHHNGENGDATTCDNCDAATCNCATHNGDRPLKRACLQLSGHDAAQSRGRGAGDGAEGFESSEFDYGDDDVRDACAGAGLLDLRDLAEGRSEVVLETRRLVDRLRRLERANRRRSAALGRAVIFAQARRPDEEAQAVVLRRWEKLRKKQVELQKKRKAEARAQRKSFLPW